LDQPENKGVLYPDEVKTTPKLPKDEEITKTPIKK
jgi:hypothetical protein